MIDMVLGDMIIRVVPKSEWKIRQKYQPVYSGNPNPYVDDDETVYEVVESSLHTATGQESYRIGLSYYGDADDKGILSQQSQDTLSVHQMVLATGRK